MPARLEPAAALMLIRARLERIGAAFPPGRPVFASTEHVAALVGVLVDVLDVFAVVVEDAAALRARLNELEARPRGPVFDVADEAFRVDLGATAKEAHRLFMAYGGSVDGAARRRAGCSCGWRGPWRVARAATRVGIQSAERAAIEDGQDHYADA